MLSFLLFIHIGITFFCYPRCTLLLRFAYKTKTYMRSPKLCTKSCTFGNRGGHFVGFYLFLAPPTSLCVGADISRLVQRSDEMVASVIAARVEHDTNTSTYVLWMCVHLFALVTCMRVITSFFFLGKPARHTIARVMGLCDIVIFINGIFPAFIRIDTSPSLSLDR